MKWEFTTIHLAAHGVLGGKLDHEKFEQVLNRLGPEGWELVDASDATPAGRRHAHVIAVFER